MKKKIIGIVLCLFIVTVLVVIVCLNSSKYDNKVITGSFTYEQSITNEPVESKYYYSDSYFNKKSTKDNDHLRSFAMDLVLTFKPTYHEDSVNQYIQKIFDETKFTNVKYYDDEKISKDTIGTSLAYKKLDDKYSLVILVIRGAGYQDEWISNFILGDSGNAKGFDEASKLVLSRLKTYLEDNKIDKYKLLVTGYSRGGAVANIVGVKLNNDTSYNIKTDDLYVYTFDAAKGSDTDKVYKNIHTVLNKNDLIPYFYPEKWGLYNNGVIYDITDNSRTIKGKCLNIFGDDKIKDGEEVSKQEFLTSLIKIMPDNREDYVKVSDSIINLYNLAKNKTDKELLEIVNFIKDNSELNTIGYTDLVTFLNSSDENKLKEVYDKLIVNCDKNYDKIAKVLSKEEYNKLKDDIYKLFVFFRPMIRRDFSHKINGKSCVMYHTMTFIYNASEIVKEHTFTNNYELVKSKDSNYKK